MTSAGSSSSQVIPNINLLEHAGSFTLVPGTMHQAPLTALRGTGGNAGSDLARLIIAPVVLRTDYHAEQRKLTDSQETSALLPCMVRPVRMRRRPVKVRTAQPRPRPALPELPGVVRINQADPNPSIL